MRLPENILSISDITRCIKSALEDGFSNVAVIGEVSNCKLHSSGHLYFTLKDESAQLSAVMWRSRVGALHFTPQDGMKVIARGKITVYEVRGVYQIDVLQLQPSGIGELQVAFERLKQKLASEGLFDAEYKKMLPKYPRRIGVVTSSTGAALQDIVNVLNRRCPSIDLILYPVKVQGAGAANEIAAAIHDFNRFGEVDLLIVGRGGGSLEDLWAFNEETVARAIYHSKIPIISAVGHEIDFTIADFVADLRAPTPSAAAELAVCTHDEIFELLSNFWYTANQIVTDNLASHRERIDSLLSSYSFNRPIDYIRQYSQRTDELRTALQRNVHHRFTLLQQQCLSLGKRVKALHPDSVLERGFAMVLKDGKVISDAKQLCPDDDVTVKLRDGTVPAVIQESSAK